MSSLSKVLFFLPLFAALSGIPSIAAGAANDPLVVVASVKVKPGTVDAFKSAADKVSISTRTQAGNLSYGFYQSIEAPNEFVTYETWRSMADLNAHLQSQVMKDFFAEVGGFFEPGYPQVNTYQKTGQ